MSTDGMMRSVLRKVENLDPYDITPEELAVVVDSARAALAALAAPPPPPAPPAEGEVAELVAALRNRERWMQLTDAQVDRVAELLEHPQPVPVPVSERPWERDGWCDSKDRCWFGSPNSDLKTDKLIDDYDAEWILREPKYMYGCHSVSLPFYALPLPPDPFPEILPQTTSEETK